MRDSSLARAPAHEPLDRFVFRQAQLIVRPRGLVISLLGPLPELAFVGARKHRPILLTLMLEDRAALAAEFARAQRHGHLDLLGFPLLPGAAIQPHFALFRPG